MHGIVRIAFTNPYINASNRYFGDAELRSIGETTPGESEESKGEFLLDSILYDGERITAGASGRFMLTNNLLGSETDTLRTRLSFNSGLS